MAYETYADARRALDNDETSCEALVSSFLERIDAQGEARTVEAEPGSTVMEAAVRNGLLRFAPTYYNTRGELDEVLAACEQIER